MTSKQKDNFNKWAVRLAITTIITPFITGITIYIHTIWPSIVKFQHVLKLNMDTRFIIKLSSILMAISVLICCLIFFAYVVINSKNLTHKLSFSLFLFVIVFLVVSIPFIFPVLFNNYYIRIIYFISISFGLSIIFEYVLESLFNWLSSDKDGSRTSNFIAIVVSLIGILLAFKN